MVRTMIRALAGTVLALALFVAGCGEQTLDAASAEESISGLIADQTGFTPEDISCPDDVTAETGETFECTFSGPDGEYTASAEITSVEGDTANFDVQAELTQ
jgi:hypothetical protein